MDRLSNYPCFYLCKRRTVKNPKSLEIVGFPKVAKMANFKFLAKRTKAKFQNRRIWKKLPYFILISKLVCIDSATVDPSFHLCKKKGSCKIKADIAKKSQDF